MAENQAVSAHIHIYGVVQGVGFRPFVLRLAREHHIAGWARNARGHVSILAQATRADLARFLAAIEQQSPPASRIERLDSQICAESDAPICDTFEILSSDEQGAGPVMPTPDLPVCGHCLFELHDPDDPRYNNPFISCTLCGPRYSIMRRVPYDRGHTSMDGFPLCPLCAAQYRDPMDRRHHAQTVCCNQCGPTLRYHTRQGACVASGAALGQAVESLEKGGIVAVKGIGGYHLACSPMDGEALARLRALKGREHKPFAVLFADHLSVLEHCEIRTEEAELLTGAARPIVLLSRKPSPMHPAVYGNSPYLGAFLAYTPLQHLLLERLGPLVMTSANKSGQRLLTDDAEMLRFLAENPALCGVLGHDRAILRPLDDSVCMALESGPAMVRRARGFAPTGLALGRNGPPILGLGAQEQSALCLFSDGYAALGAQNADADHQDAHAFAQCADDLMGMLRVRPKLLSCDLHPDYTATRYAKESGLPYIMVQHHHAHIASVLAEHRLEGPVIGVAFDGTGFGTDGTVWGGEFLIATADSFTRAAHLRPVLMLGGDESVRQGWKSALCHLRDAGVGIAGEPNGALVDAALRQGINTLPSSSMGRAFDAVSALLQICSYSEYSGQCAIELENAATGFAADTAPLPFDISNEDGCPQIDLRACMRALHERYHGGEGADALAYAFHEAVARLIAQVCAQLSAQSGIVDVALSGGVFLNRLLLRLVLPLLEGAGLRVYRNRAVSAGDGGIALGQVYVALHSQAAGQQQSTEGSERHVHCGAGCDH